MREIRLEYVHRGETYLTASRHSYVIFVIFLIGRRDGENNGFLAGLPFPPSVPHAWFRALILFPFPFERLPRRLSIHILCKYKSCSLTTKKQKIELTNNPGHRDLRICQVVAVQFCCRRGTCTNKWF